MAKIMLIDGHSLAYRAFFALPTDMATASGQVTNAVFGFTSMLINLLKDHQPDGIAVAFDLPEPTFRHKMIDDYKAGRQAAPDILRQQLGLVRQIVEALHIPILDLPGYEADDVIATIATQGRDRGDDVIVVTGDRDAYQLVEDPHIKVLYNKRGVSDYAFYDEAGIAERTGVVPTDYPQYAALRGDKSDNLPGVPGVGEKTAAKLINTYGDLDGIYQHLDDLTPKLRENLAAHEAVVRLNAQATPLVRDAPIECAIDDLQMGGWDLDEVRDLFNFLEFRSLWDRLMDAVGGPTGAPGAGVDSPSIVGTLDVETRPVVDTAALGEAVEALVADGGPVAIGVAWQGPVGRSRPAGLAFATDGDHAYWVPAEVLRDASAAATLERIWGIDGGGYVTHDAKALMRGVAQLGFDARNLLLDTAIAAYLIEPAESEYRLEDVAVRFAGVEVRSPDAAPDGQLDFDGSVESSDDAARAAGAVALLHQPMSEALDARGLSALHDDIERPLVRVLARMEVAGVGVDTDYLRSLVTEFTQEVRALDEQIQELAGHPFLVNSTKQLRVVLFEELGLEPQKKTKTGYSTDAASLEKLRGQHPIIDLLLRYREVEKLRSTYGEGLVSEVADDGRIHATFNQTVARTGRLSSDRPNLHNIPIRTEEGRRFRGAFVPADGCRFLVADYNQIELRVIAHLAEDPGLIEAFTTGQDIHEATASRIFDVAPAKVTTAQRSKAKMVSYGLAYGMESYGLAQRLAIPVDEAAEILAAYFKAFPSVKQYMATVVAEARDRGYTETLFGRRRQIPELASSNYRIRQAGERQAMNAGIQGLAADIFKVALVRLDAALEAKALQARVILQVHDEVILEVSPEEAEQAEAIVREVMCGAAELNVPLEVNVAWGDTWADAKA
ncbi:MAG: DNA polymerase I [Acidimicrobiales bacterium]